MDTYGKREKGERRERATDRSSGIAMGSIHDRREVAHSRGNARRLAAEPLITMAKS